MDASVISQYAARALYLALILSLPLLVICLAVGIVVSIFQATTQIHEQSLAFVPKLVAVILALLVMGTWISGQLGSFFREIAGRIATL